MAALSPFEILVAAPRRKLSQKRRKTIRNGCNLRLVN
jgi:hypothetical protein